MKILLHPQYDEFVSRCWDPPATMAWLPSASRAAPCDSAPLESGRGETGDFCYNATREDALSEKILRSSAGGRLWGGVGECGLGRGWARARSADQHDDLPKEAKTSRLEPLKCFLLMTGGRHHAWFSVVCGASVGGLSCAARIRQPSLEPG